MEIAILVNNVGMSYVHPDFIENVCSEKFVNDIINCNIVSVTKMTAIVLPGMVKRKGGVIANIDQLIVFQVNFDQALQSVEHVRLKATDLIAL